MDHRCRRRDPRSPVRVVWRPWPATIWPTPRRPSSSQAAPTTAARTTSPGRSGVSLQQVADAFSVVTGRRVHYVNETVGEAWASRRTYGAPDWQVEAWVTTYLQIAAGELDVVTGTVPRVTGHPAVSLREFLSDHPESYEHLLE